MPVPTAQQKLSAAVLSNIAEALEELAYTEAGEADDSAVLDVCSFLIRIAGRVNEISLLKRHGASWFQKPTETEIPF